MTKNLLVILILGISTAAWGKPVFLQSKGEAWEKQVLETIESVNQSLPAHWPRPENYNIVYAPEVDDSYHTFFKTGGRSQSGPVYHKLLLLGEKSSPETFVHEYGHLVMDVLLRKQSPEWRYNIAWLLANKGSVKGALESRKTALKQLQNAHEEYKVKVSQGDTSPLTVQAVGRTKKAIESTKEFIAIYQDAVKTEESSPYSLTEFVALRALHGHLELFSDTLAVLYYDNWSVMKDIITQTTTVEMVKPYLPPINDLALAFETYNQQRNFVETYPLEDLKDEPWMTRNPYLWFGPARSYIRNSQHGEMQLTDTEVIQALGESIIKIFREQLIPTPTHINRSLVEKNQALLTQMGEEIEQNRATRHASNP